MELTRRELTSLTQNRDVHNYIRGRSTSRCMWRLVVLKMLDWKAASLSKLCIVLPVNHTMDQEVTTRWMDGWMDGWMNR